MKLKPIKRTTHRESKMRNLPCPCGSIKEIVIHNGKLSDSYIERIVDRNGDKVRIKIKYKDCCMKKNWLEPVFNYPNNAFGRILNKE